MPRKGFRRVHTGCRTCKIRRIKCDETHPFCTRCTSTGRKCDGYLPWVSRSVQCTQPSTIPGAEAMDLQSLGFFREILVPVLTGPVRRSFWTQFVPQLAHHLPAARHATVAISSLLNSPRNERHGSELAYNGLILRRYNAAIREILMAPPDNLDAVVTVCILFFCIEVLRGQPEAAMSHYHHGANILKSYDHSGELSAIFRHIRTLAIYMFSSVLDCDAGRPPGTGSFQDLDQAQESLDWLAYRSVTLAFAKDKVSRDPSTTSYAQSSIEAKCAGLHKDLDAWIPAVAGLRPEEYSRDIHILDTRWRVCKGWINVGLGQRELHDVDEVIFKRTFEIALERFTPTQHARRGF